MIKRVSDLRQVGGCDFEFVPTVWYFLFFISLIFCCTDGVAFLFVSVYFLLKFVFRSLKFALLLIHIPFYNLKHPKNQDPITEKVRLFSDYQFKVMIITHLGHF